MTPVFNVGGGGQVSLGAVLARAGEGTIFEVSAHPAWVAKVFHPTLGDRDAKVRKVAAMIGVNPPGAIQPDGFVVLTWPLHVLSDDTGVVGYVMPRVDTRNVVEIHSISNPSNRMNPLPAAPQWTRGVKWMHLVNIAANLCLAVDAVHRAGAVIGDFQERNILVADTTQVTLVDCDSMQFTDASGQQFLCGVGRPDFTAPELASKNLRTEAREKSSDLFALAVHIYLLLMAGNHPFMRGTWTGAGDQPDALTLARSGFSAGAPGSPLHGHPLAPPIGFLPPDIQRMFMRAFTEGAHNPAVRPSADEWREALLRIQITTCPRGVHEVPVEADPCPWCVIDDERSARRAAAQRPPQQTVVKVATVIDYPVATAPPPQFALTPAPAAPPAARSNKVLLSVVGAALAIVAVFAIVLTINRGESSSPTAVSTTIRDLDEGRGTGQRSVSPTSTRAAVRPAAEVALNVSAPISQPACDGTGIVVLGSAVQPGRYDVEIQRFLDAHPGASYLRTDHACPSLRQASGAGDPIYAVYYPAGRTQPEVCAAVRAAGGDAYGKWLDESTEPTYRIPC